MGVGDMSQPFNEQSLAIADFADQLTPTADPKQLHETVLAARKEAEAATRRLQALQGVSDIALAHVRLEDVLHSLLEYIQRLMAVDNVAILLPTPDNR